MNQKQTKKNSNVGYISKSKTGKTVLKVEQDVTLKKGDVIIIQKPSENIDGLVRAGFLTEEAGEERKSKVPDWKLGEATLLPRKD